MDKRKFRIEDWEGNIYKISVPKTEKEKVYNGKYLYHDDYRIDVVPSNFQTEMDGKNHLYINRQFTSIIDDPNAEHEKNFRITDGDVINIANIFNPFAIIHTGLNVRGKYTIYVRSKSNFVNQQFLKADIFYKSGNNIINLGYKQINLYKLGNIQDRYFINSCDFTFGSEMEEFKYNENGEIIIALSNYIGFVKGSNGINADIDLISIQLNCYNDINSKSNYSPESYTNELVDKNGLFKDIFKY